MYRKIAFIVIWYFVAAFTPSFAATDLPYTIEVAGISKVLKDSTVTSKDQDQKFTISDPKFASLVELIQPGDRIDAVLDSNNPLLIKDLKISKPCKGSTRSLALFVSFLIIIGFFTLVTKGSPKKFVIGADNRYSNSKIQVVLWFSVLMTVYLATLGLRVLMLGWDYFGGIGIAENLLALSGISTLTYGAAKAITVQKVENAPKVDREGPKSGGQPNILSDLFQNDNKEFDLGDTQMFFFILLAVATFLMLSFHFLGWLEYAKQISLPDVDTTLLSSLGLSQGAYLAKKAASKPGQG
jgi:hypothetical protein